MAESGPTRSKSIASDPRRPPSSESTALRPWGRWLGKVVEPAILVAVAAGAFSLGKYVASLEARDTFSSATRKAAEVLAALKVDESGYRDADLTARLLLIEEEVTKSRRPVRTLAEYTTQTRFIRYPPRPGVSPKASEGSDGTYEVLLTREPRGFTGVCWEFASPLALGDSDELAMRIAASAEGNYQFKFELDDPSRGQTNVVQKLASSADLLPLTLPLTKVAPEVRSKLGRLCVAIAADAASPMESRIRMADARFQERSP